MKEMTYRHLTSQEIIELEKQNCRSIDGWEKVLVSEYFITSNIHFTTFSGSNHLGLFSEKVNVPNGGVDYCGIYNAHINNCTIANQAYIKNIGTSISNYKIEENVIIQNIGSLSVGNESQFGNGTIVCPINEAGGRDVMIYNKLSAHTAYLMAFYRDNDILTNQLKKIADYESLQVRSNKGTIGHHTTIINSGCLKSINTGSHCTIEGASYLEEGTVNSCKDAPAYIGPQVNAAHFIVCSGSIVSDGATLRNCFVGQGCEISNNYTAENSLFFANSQCLQGEACSIFAGPYTVTHHKSTLLIAGYYSFFNAGSGTNQSNHMYKLGPLHQGIMARGGKTGSDSYILWPAKIGAFTMVLGRHYGNADTSDLPFSYLIETDGKSVLMPAQNIFNVGTTRDIEKWPKRDQRKGEILSDYVICEALNPYSINQIISGIEVLKQLQNKAGSQAKNLMYKNTQISLTAVNRGIKLYEQALVKYVGDELIHMLKHTNFEVLKNTDYSDVKNYKWVDLAGLICREDQLEIFYEQLETTDQPDGSTADQFFNKQFDNYTKQKRNHVLFVLKDYFNIDFRTSLSLNLKEFIEEWIQNNDKIKSSILMDAKKEFNVKSRIGFGIDGDDTVNTNDFEAVRGTIASNSFIKNIEQHYTIVNKDAENIAYTLNK